MTMRAKLLEDGRPTGVYHRTYVPGGEGGGASTPSCRGQSEDAHRTRFRSNHLRLWDTLADGLFIEGRRCRNGKQFFDKM